MAEKAQILLASPNSEWLNIAKEHFLSEGYTVKEATTGKEAQLIASENELFAVVIDFNLREYSSVQVVRFLKISKPAIITVMLVFPETALEDYKFSVKDLVKLGVNDVIKEPNNIEKIQSSLEGFQSITQIMAQIEFRETNSPEVELIKDPKKFTPIAIDEFYFIRYMLFDVYIKIGDHKFIKILHAGETFDRIALDRYKERSAKELHILNKDRNRYINFCNAMADKLSKNDKVESKEKVFLIKNAVTKFLEEFEERDVLESIMGQSKQVINSVLSLIEFDKGLSQYMRQYLEMDPSHYTHTFLVTLFSCNILQQFEWDSNLARETIAMGAMLHDLGKIELDPEIRKKKKEDLTPEELEEYKLHPGKGAELINNCPLINPTVTQIILNHHENRDGSGYPLGIGGPKINPICEIVAFADYYVEYITDRKFTPAIGFVHMIQNSMVDHLYDSNIVKALGRTFVSKQNQKNIA